MVAFMSTGRKSPLQVKSPEACGGFALRRGRLAGIMALLLFAPLGLANPDPVPEEGTQPELGPQPRLLDAEGTPIPKFEPVDPEPSPEPSEADQVALFKTLPSFKYVEDDAPVRSANQNPYEHEAYNYVVAHAHRQSPEALARHSLKEVPFAHLFKEIRRDYHRELIRIEGHLIRLIELKATSFLRETEGITKIYDAWILPKDEQFPVNIAFTELPEGIKPALRIENTWVTFDGYYFKLIRYESGEKKDDRHVWKQAPLLIGRTITPGRPPSEGNDITFGTMMTLLVIGLSLVIVIALALSIWFRRGDRRVRSQVQNAQFGSNPFQNAPPPVEPGPGWERFGEKPQ
jgi:hypothetical protein